MSNHRIFVFPGQGSQSAGMAAEFMSHQATASIFEEANATLGFDVAKIMREGTPEELRNTAITQPAMFIAGYAAWKYLEKHAGKSLPELTKYVAGHSLGEFTALTVAGVFDFATGLKLVKARAEAMAELTKAGTGAMAAILGIPIAQVETYCHSTGCYVANDNAEGQVVISGDMAAVDEASNIAAMEGPRKIMRLDVAGAFHTPLMYEAAEKLQAELEHVAPKDPTVPVLMNVTAEPLSKSEEVKARLTQQMTQRVRWRESMQYAAAHGITQVVELGTGKVLAGLAKRCDPALVGKALTSPWEIDEFLEAEGL